GSVERSLLDVVDRTELMWLMAALPARGMRAMHAAIKRDLGVTLFSTGRGRTLAQQWEIFGGEHARYTPCDVDQFNADTAISKERTKWWPPKARRVIAALLADVVIPEAEFWTKIALPNGLFPATAAVPGTSPHGWWCADDLALTDGADPNTAPD